MNLLELISIPVTDQSRAKAFYLKLGFEVLVEAPYRGDKLWIQMRLPGNPISIALVSWFDNMPAGCIKGLIIKTDDLAKSIKDLAASGVIVGEVDHTPWGKFASVTDPDGNQLSFHCNSTMETGM